MRWNKIFFLLYLLTIICGCIEEPEGPPNPPDLYIYGGEISYIEKIYVDSVSVAESLNVARIYLSLSEGRANSFTNWTVYDPDDPATDINWVDPNDVYGEWGEDNGYIGSLDLEDYFPVPLPTFHNTRSDAYYGGIGSMDFLTNEYGDAEIFMRVYPDNSSYQGYHPGDNFSIRCVIGDTAYYSDTIYAWKKMRIEYDYMEGCTLSTLGFTTIERAFKGENVLYGGNRDYNHCAYLEFKDDSTHLFRSDTNLYPNYFIDVSSMRDFYLDYRDDTAHYPFYVVGACSLLTHPGVHGVCLVRPFFSDSLIRIPYLTSVFVPNIINDFGGELTSAQLKIVIGLVASHELGHFAARLEEAYGSTSGEHVDPQHCIMGSSTWMAQNLRYGENSFFCPACIYRFRGNMYVGGTQVFVKRGEK